MGKRKKETRYGTPLSACGSNRTYFLLNRGSDLFPPQTAEPNDDLLQYIKDVGAFASVVIVGYNTPF